VFVPISQIITDCWIENNIFIVAVELSHVCSIIQLKRSNITGQKNKSPYLVHETKRNVLVRFVSLALVLVAYFAFVTWKYGLGVGAPVTLLSWSFFVLCTPIADAGFLLDFPVRLIISVRMIYSEMIVWVIAIGSNLFYFFRHPSFYEKSELLSIFHHILENPWPFWGIIVISWAGTFMSIYFGDEMVDVAKHLEREKYRQHRSKYFYLLTVFAIVLIILSYIYLIKKMNISIPLF